MSIIISVTVKPAVKPARDFSPTCNVSMDLPSREKWKNISHKPNQTETSSHHSRGSQSPVEQEAGFTAGGLTAYHSATQNSENEKVCLDGVVLSAPEDRMELSL